MWMLTEVIECRWVFEIPSTTHGIAVTGNVIISLAHASVCFASRNV